MVIVNLLIEFELPFVEGLKGRRAVLNSIKERLKKMNLSVLDISSQYPKEAALAVVFASIDEKNAQKKIQKIEKLLYESFPQYSFDISFEIL